VRQGPSTTRARTTLRQNRPRHSRIGREDRCYASLVEQCHCGKQLHYSDPTLQRIVERLIDLHGTMLIVTVGGRSWLVPRHYIALHGIKGGEVHSLGFEEIAGKGEYPPLAIGTLVEKCNSKAGEDGHGDGALARILSVIPQPLRGAYLYFVEWEDLPGTPVAIEGSRIRPLSEPASLKP